jgi:SAM-dependent methyltransferase
MTRAYPVNARDRIAESGASARMEAPSCPEWDERFAGPEALFGDEPDRFIVAAERRLERCSTVLLLADGDARNGVFFARRGHYVTSVDVSKVAQEKGMARALRAGVRLDFVHSDCLAFLESARRFDGVVLSFGQFSTGRQRDLLFDLIHDRVEAGGLLILQGFDERHASIPDRIGPGDRGVLYDERFKARSLSRWHPIVLQVADVTMTDGLLSGPAQLFQFIGQKLSRSDDAVASFGNDETGAAEPQIR